MNRLFGTLNSALLFLTCLSSCSSASTDIEVSVLEDVTDTLLIRPSSTDIFTTANIDSNSLAGIRVTVSTISDYQYNSIYNITLPSEHLLLSNPGDRVQKMKLFGEKISTSIALINNSSRRPQSDVYNTVISELNRLAQTQAKQKVAIVYSDLGENTSAFSVYKAADMSLLETNPAKVMSILSQAIKPGALAGVQVYLIFKPSNARDDHIFSQMSALYKEILTKVGARVYIGANILPHQ